MARLQEHCDCEWHQAINYNLDAFSDRKIDYKEYSALQMFIIAKYGINYFEKFNKKCAEYYEAILNDMPYPYGIFDNNIGCHFTYFIMYKQIYYLNNLSEKIVMKRLSIPTIKQILYYHQENPFHDKYKSNEKLDILQIFKFCIEYNDINYFTTFIDGFQGLIYSIHISEYIDLVIQTNIEQKILIQICDILSKMYGKEKILDGFKMSRNHGRFAKTQIVFDNYNSICNIFN
jgi:hypothetical protein